MKKNQITLIAGGIILFIILVIIIVNFPIVVIGPGNRGVVFNNQSGLEKGRILPEGTSFRTPFFESVITMPVRVQKSEFQEQAGTSNSQVVNTKIVINWHLDAGKVDQTYDQVGNIDQVESIAFTNNVQDAVKAAISKYQALEIQRNRDNVTIQAREYLQNKVKKYNIIVDGISFTNISFSDQFTQAIENAVTAEQNAKAAENKVAQSKAEADQRIAEANGEAQANQLKQQSLTPAILTQMWIARWDGKLPQYQLGGATPLINLPTVPGQ